MNLVDQLADQDPDQIAIIDRHQSITFGELHQRVAGGADFLRKQNLGPGQRVLVLHPISFGLYEILLACLHAGLTVILIDPAKGADFIKHCLDLTPPDCFVGSTKAQILRLKFRGLKKAITTGVPLPFTRRWSPIKSDSHPVDLASDHPALTTFTSGSTGTPKGVVRSHGFLLAQDRTLAPGLNLKPGQIDLVTLPVFLLSNLAHGVTSVIADTDLRKPGFPDTERILKQAQNCGITRCTASPAFFQKLPDTFFDHLDEFYTGGAPVFPELLMRFPEKAHAVYGSSEAEPISHFSARDLTAEIRAKIAVGSGLPAGMPIDDISVKIIDQEILVTGEHVLKSYLDGRGDSETKVEIDGEIWHRTGDAGHLDETGMLWLLGRHSQRWLGHYPLQIEAAVHLQHSGQTCAFFQGTLYLEKDLKVDLPWAPIEKIKVIERIPMDSRHNAKVDYLSLPAETP